MLEFPFVAEESVRDPFEISQFRASESVSSAVLTSASVPNPPLPTKKPLAKWSIVAKTAVALQGHQGKAQQQQQDKVVDDPLRDLKSIKERLASTKQTSQTGKQPPQPSGGVSAGMAKHHHNGRVAGSSTGVDRISTDAALTVQEKEAQKAAFELKNKLAGLVVALRSEDGDDMDDGDDDGGTDERKMVHDVRTPPIGAAQRRAFGGQHIQLSHRTALVNEKKLLQSTTAAAENFKKRIRESKRMWRQTMNQSTYGSTIGGSSATSEHGEDELDDSDDPFDTSSQFPNDEQLPRRDSVASRAQGQARRWLESRDGDGRRRTTTAQNGAVHSVENEESDEEDGYLFARREQEMDVQQAARWRRAMFGSDEAHQHEINDARMKKRELHAKRRATRAFSKFDLQLLRGGLAKSDDGSGLLPPDLSGLWARENDMAELFTEYMSCVRKQHSDWKWRFIAQPNVEGGRETKQDPNPNEHEELNSMQTSMLGTPRAGPIPPLVQPLPPPGPDVQRVPSLRQSRFNPSAINAIVHDVMVSLGEANPSLKGTSGAPAVAQRTKSGQSVPRYRCPHCSLLPTAKDNHSLLAVLQAQAGRIIDPDDDGQTQAAAGERVISAVNADTAIYTGVLGESHWTTLQLAHEMLPPEVTIASIFELDRTMWRHVATELVTQHSNENPADEMDEDEEEIHRQLLAGGRASEAQQKRADRIKGAFMKIFENDTTWRRQVSEVRISREKEIRNLTKTVDASKRTYDISKSQLVAVQLEAEEAAREFSAAKQLATSASDIVAMIGEQNQLERELEAATVRLCDLEFERRSVKKHLSKATWTASGLGETTQKLRDILHELHILTSADHAEVSSGKQHHASDPPNAAAVEVAEDLDVGKPMDDETAARLIYGNGPHRKSSESDRMGQSTGQNALNRFRDIVRSKVQRSAVQDAAIGITKVDCEVDDILADVDMILRGSAECFKGHNQQHSDEDLVDSEGSANVATTELQNHIRDSIRSLLGRRCEQCDHFLGAFKYCPATGELHAIFAGDTDATSKESLKVDSIQQRVGTVHRVQVTASTTLTSRHTRRDIETNNTNEIQRNSTVVLPLVATVDVPRPLQPSLPPQSTDGAKHGAAQFTKDLPPTSAISSSRDHTRSSTAAVELLTQSLGSAYFPFEGSDTQNDVESATNLVRGQQSSPYSRESAQPTASTSAANASRSRIAPSEKKRRKQTESTKRRRVSMMLAKSGDSRWMDEAQKDSSDSDSELEYADCDHDSEDEDLEIRRKSLAAAIRSHSVVADGSSASFAAASPASSSPFRSAIGSRRATGRISFRQVLAFGDDDVPPRDSEDPPAADETVSGNAVAEDEVEPESFAAAIVSRRRQSAVKERLVRRKKLKEAVQRTRAIGEDPPAATEVADAVAANSLPEASKRIAVDCGVANLLTVMQTELRWRMAAPLSEGCLAPAAVVEKDKDKKPTGRPSTSEHEVDDELSALLKKYRKSLPTVKHVEPRPTWAAGQSAVSNATAAATAAISNLITGSTGSGGTAVASYALCNPSGTAGMELAEALRGSEESWLNRICPLLEAVCDRVARRTQRFRDAGSSSHSAVAAPPVTNPGKGRGRREQTPPAPTENVTDAKQTPPSKMSRPGARGETRLSEKDLAARVESLRGAVELAFQPLRPMLDGILQLERQLDDITQRQGQQGFVPAPPPRREVRPRP